MKILLRRVQTEWPVWLAVSFIALLPFRRLAEIPLSIFAISLLFLLRSDTHKARIKVLLPLLLPLFLCFWIPMLVSSIDSYVPQKSWVTSLAAVRYFMAAMSIGVLLHSASMRWQVLRWCSYLLIFWAVDGYVQLIAGVDIFGIAMHEERLNALFGDKYQFYGPTLAMLSPLLFEFARRRWPVWAWGASFALILGAVMISGMRAGWMALGLVVFVYFLLMFRKDNRDLRRATVITPVLALAVIVLSYLVSPTVQERVSRTLTIAQGSESSVDYALSWRLPIFKASLRMFRENPVNGVGVRAFPVAYPDYAPADDYHLVHSDGGMRATHAHNIVLEVMADTGTIGLLGLVLGFILLWRAWRAMLPANRQEAFPYALALVLILFPLNSHFAIYGVYTSSLIWMLMGLAAATWKR
ncbi:MAG: O-antigen ligase family protein [Proteobacteria bacterium]|nr:O-antigen ligase family protein [Pseudomonadota bacterium]